MHRLVFYIIILLPLISHAYIGPGMAGGLIAAIFGIILAIIIAFIGILYYPIKRALKNRKNTKASDRNDLP